jgi:phage/plasmid primase-like uncharacterized protein
MKEATTTPDGRPTQSLKSTRSIAPQKPENAGAAGVKGGLRFDTWHAENAWKIREAQIEDGHAWLCGTMVNAPDKATLERHITDKYDAKNWRNHHGKRGGKEAFNPCWDTSKGGAPLLKITTNDFKQKQYWDGNPTITRLWQVASGERQQAVRRDAQSRRQQIREEMEAEQREEDERTQRAIAECERLEEERKAANIARKLAASIAEYKVLPETRPGAYFFDKGFGGVHIPGLKRGCHKTRGGYDILPIQDAETGEITSLAYFWDEPFKNAEGELVRKTFAAGGRVAGCAVFLTGFPPKNFKGVFAVGEGAATVLTVKGCQSAANVCYVAALSVQGLEPVYRALTRRCRKAAAFRLILDNDWQKALEIDPETGQHKQNAGLEWGSELAMKRNLRFFMPDFSAFKDAEGSLSDFNDLARVAGVAGADEVQRQLVLHYPDPDVVFKGEREKYREWQRALYAQHDVTVIDERYIPADLIKPGRVNIVIAIPGTGKSTAMKAFYAHHPEKSRLTICPLEALAVNKAEELGDTCYQGISDVTLRGSRHVVICQDSLPRLVPLASSDDTEAEPEVMPTFDIVTLEEPTSMFDRQTGDITRKPLVRDTMRAQVQEAETVIAVCADFGPPELSQLERWRDGERFNVIIDEYIEPWDAYIHASANDVQTAALEALAAGQRFAYPCTTAAAAREADALFKERSSDGRRGLCVIADCDGELAVQAFSRRPNHEVKRYHYVTYSPKWETGLSVNAGHGYTRLFSEVDAGLDAPRRFLQRCARFREIKRWDVYIDPKIGTYTTDPEAIKARWGSSLGAWDSELLGLTADRRRGIKDADYESLVTDKIVTENLAKTNLRYNTLRLMYIRGARLHFLPPRNETREPGEDTPQAADLISERRELDRAAECASLIAARPITDAEAVTHKRIRRTAEQSAELTAYRTRRTHGLRWDDPLEERHITEYRGGRLEEELRRLELAGSDQALLRYRSERQHAPAERYCPDTRFYGVEAFAYRTALEVYNVDPTTYKLAREEPVTNDSPAVQSAIEAFIVRRDDLVAARFKLPLPDKMRAEPLTVFGNILRRMNQTTTKGKNKAGRERRIDEERLTCMCDLITARREREAERLGFWEADLEGTTDEGTVKAISNTTLLECPHLSVPEPTTLLPTAETHPLGREGTVKAISNTTLLECPHLSVPEPTTPLPAADTCPLGLDALNYLERVMSYLHSHPEPLEPALLRELAVHEVAQTAPEDEQGWVYDLYQRRLLDGTPKGDATDDDLLRDGLAALGWARTRALLNRYNWDGNSPAIRQRYSWGRPEWCAFAEQALKARPSAPPCAQGAAS